jgi:protein SCO1/2
MTQKFTVSARFAAGALFLLVASLAAAQSLYRGGGGLTGEPAAAVPPPAVLKNIEIEQKLGSQLPLDLQFRDENGHEVRLAQFFGSRPVVLSLVYYECPMLCGEVLNGMSSAFNVLKFDIGKDYEVVTVSFDPRETPKLAAAKKERYVKLYNRAGAEAGWHFLTGPAESINALAQAVGFHYQWDERTQQFAHAAAIMVATPHGKLAQYLYGVDYAPKDLRLALVEASQDKLGSLVDQVLLYCYHYDPRTGKYGAVISRILQIAGVLTIVILGGGLLLLMKLEPKASRRAVSRSASAPGSTSGSQPGGQL